MPGYARNETISKWLAATVVAATAWHDRARVDVPACIRWHIRFRCDTPDACLSELHENRWCSGWRGRRIRRSELEFNRDTALDWAGLAHLARRNARKLSGGERQRLALARARVLSPAVLLLDEPTTNMDQEARQQSFFLIRRMVSEGMGVVIASHDRQVIGQLGDRHLDLADGRLREVETGNRPGQARPGDNAALSAGEAH